MATPTFLFTRIAAATKSFEIERMFDELLINCVIIHAAQDAKVMNLWCKICIDIMLKIGFKIEAFSVLVIIAVKSAV